MSDETRVWKTLIITIGITIVLVAAMLTYKSHLKEKYALENDYSQETLMGVVGVYWVKDDKVLE